MLVIDEGKSHLICSYHRDVVRQKRMYSYSYLLCGYGGIGRK